MSLIKSIETHIKSWFKVCFFLWMMTYVYAAFSIIVLHKDPGDELGSWSDFGLQAFTFLLCNAIIPYYIVKGLVLLVKKYPQQAKVVFTAMLVAAAYKVIEKSK